MQKSDLFKMTIDENIADKNLILKNILNSHSTANIPNKAMTGRYIKLSFRLAAAFLIIAAVVSFNTGNMPDTSNTRYTGQNQQSGTAFKEKNDFTIVAYAAVKDNSNISPGVEVDTNTKTELKPDLKVQMPFGKINRGNVKTTYGYEVTFEGFGVACTGENIKNVTYTSENGMLSYFDVELMKQLESKGELYICQIPVSADVINPEMGYKNIKKAFSKLWSSGQLDEFKNKYFDGKDINLDDYRIGFHGAPDTTGERIYMQIYNKENGNPSYYKTGPVVIADPGRNVGWMPEKATDILKKDANVHYEDLPADTITVSAEFNDGSIVTKTLKLSFDKDGNVIAELKEK